jgi:hypothetical protein
VLTKTKDNIEEKLEIITRAKKSCVAYSDPPDYIGKGCPRKKGDKIKLFELFESARNLYKTEKLYLYGKLQEVNYYSLDLLWGKTLYIKLRFVLVEVNENKIILVSTLLDLTPLEIIEAYSYRYKIEVSFKSLKEVCYGFCYHFWTSYMPKLDRYYKINNLNNIESVTDEKQKRKIFEALAAIEKYVMCCCIALGILQMLSLKYSDKSINSKFKWLRTYSNEEFVSEATIAYYLRKYFFNLLY